jgi:DNA-binding MltR family transcriptional regulator
MTFLTEREDEVEFLREVTTLPDRVVGLLAPVLIERRLVSLIKSRWTDATTRGGTLFEDLFSSSGELANHDSRLRIGLAMQFYSPDAFTEMRSIAKIRNEFAHELKAQDFSVSPICDFVTHLKIIDRFPAPSTFAIGSTKPEVAAEKMADEFWNGLIKLSAISDICSSKNRYLRSIELFSLFLYREQIQPSNGSPRF